VLLDLECRISQSGGSETSAEGFGVKGASGFGLELGEIISSPLAFRLCPLDEVEAEAPFLPFDRDIAVASIIIEGEYDEDGMFEVCGLGGRPGILGNVEEAVEAGVRRPFLLLFGAGEVDDRERPLSSSLRVEDVELTFSTRSLRSDCGGIEFNCGVGRLDLLYTSGTTEGTRAAATTFAELGGA
jgi:hypothetical protein